MKYVTALIDYNHKQTGEQVITQGTAYLVFKENKSNYWISNDNDRFMWADKNLFRARNWSDLK